MRHPHVLITSVLFTAACASSPSEPSGPVDPQSGPVLAAGCYTVQLGRKPSPDVSLPSLIELTQEAAPGFVTPGRLAVREPGTGAPKAPISSWIPTGPHTLELSLGGGYTGYTFSLTAIANGGWAGEGIYFADMGLEPTPARLPVRLRPRSCP